MTNKMFNASNDYKDQIVSFIDILGFSNTINRIEDDNELHERIHWVLTYINSYKRSSMTQMTVQSNLKVSVFSDSIVFTGDLDDYHDILWSSAHLHTKLLGYGILTRGGISTGSIFHSDEILYGKGLIKAHEIESKAAVYPRIVLDPSFSQSLPKEYLNILLSIDTDGLYYIDPFCLDVAIGDADSQLADGYDPHEIFLDEVGTQIEVGINNSKSIEHKAKWNWLSTRHEIAKKEYLKTRETRWSLLLKKT